jgi:hypothetical protein
MVTSSTVAPRTTRKGRDKEDNVSPEPSRPPVVKLSFNVAQHQFDTLKKLSEEKGVSMTEILRHAIALEAYLQKEVEDDARIIVEDKNGNKRRELVLIGM